MQRLTVFAALGAALLVSWSSAASAQEYKWRMATIDQENGVYFTKIAKPFAEWVDRLTGGRMIIEPLPAGTVGNIFKLHEAVEDGLVEMANVPPSFLGTADPFNAIVTSYPTGLGGDSFHAWLYAGGGQELWVEHRRETMGMHALVLGSGPSEWFAHSHVPIREVEDLENVKIRALGNFAAVLKDKFGAAPTTVPGAEIYGMLEKHGIDAAEYSMPAENYARGFHEIAKYVIYPGIHAPTWSFEAVMTLDNWESLPDDIKLAMEAAARIVTHDSFLKMINEDLDAVAKIRAGNNEMIRLSDDFQAQLREASREWALQAAAEAKAEGNPWPEKVADSIFAFQDRWIANSRYMVVDHAD